TAGHGIVHSEMPNAAQPGGVLWGYQFWVNLPARLKMTRPRYQDLRAEAFHARDVGDAHVRVLAGQVGKTRGAVEGIVTDPVVLDVTMARGARLVHALPPAHAVCAYVVSGGVTVGAEKTDVPAGRLATLGPGKTIDVRADEASRLLVLAAA